MKKVAVIVNSDNFNWVSCKAISSNLHQAVRKINEKNITTKFFSVTPSQVYDSIHWGYNQLENMLNKVLEFNPDVIYLPDHVPHPAQVLIPLLQLHPQISKKKFIVHAYGDYSLYPDLWKLLGHEMKNLQLSILASSKKQSAYVDFFLKSSVNRPQVIPFPIDDHLFQFSQSSRTAIRRKHRIANDETIFIYTGRISLQKNIDALINSFSLIEKVNKKVRLFIIGDYDDIGSPNLGHKTHHGYLFQKIESVLQEQSDAVRKKINFLGSMSRKKIAEYLSAADVFISLSTYHDEDYGMSPAEALASGLPAILTDWGGYSDFATYTDDVELVTVNLQKDNLTINTGEVIRAAKIILQSTNKRTARAKKFLSAVSTTAVADRLKSEFTQPAAPFKGFNYRLDIWMQEQKSRLIYPINTNADSFYNELYRHYAEKSR